MTPGRDQPYEENLQPGVSCRTCGINLGGKRKTNRRHAGQARYDEGKRGWVCDPSCPPKEPAKAPVPKEEPKEAPPVSKPAEPAKVPEAQVSPDVVGLILKGLGKADYAFVSFAHPDYGRVKVEIGSYQREGETPEAHTDRVVKRAKDLYKEAIAAHSGA